MANSNKRAVLSDKKYTFWENEQKTKPYLVEKAEALIQPGTDELDKAYEFRLRKWNELKIRLYIKARKD